MEQGKLLLSFLINDGGNFNVYAMHDSHLYFKLLKSRFFQILDVISTCSNLPTSLYVKFVIVST